MTRYPQSKGAGRAFRLPDKNKERKRYVELGSYDLCHLGIHTSFATASTSVPDRFVFEPFLFDSSDAKAGQKKGLRCWVRAPN